ncbi:hypothetical protein CEUSTIGMA_g8833.t1 [Chlamydomonas eustigma]|uniref:Uncharacterized protein n=1 Tax=Chlamydomonas eustigma TaxID=1157962 RepID=A0A250XER0_9CHLO|nr:hypothetical protein CEUSTIGMA_g8833.t1 [Chlamydomonas eustigma]|eukprot:GAX81402.1 hypothetical protein CEUSTIGMA_g8833.t1 [Chlamydomonas eustigma]
MLLRQIRRASSSCCINLLQGLGFRFNNSTGGRVCGRRGRGSSVGGGRNVISDDDKKTKSGRGRGRGAKSKKLAEMHEGGSRAVFSSLGTGFERINEGGDSLKPKEVLAIMQETGSFFGSAPGKPQIPRTSLPPARTMTDIQKPATEQYAGPRRIIPCPVSAKAGVTQEDRVPNPWKEQSKSENERKVEGAAPLSSRECSTPAAVQSPQQAEAMHSFDNTGHSVVEQTKGVRKRPGKKERRKLKVMREHYVSSVPVQKQHG